MTADETCREPKTGRERIAAHAVGDGVVGGCIEVLVNGGDEVKIAPRTGKRDARSAQEGEQETMTIEGE
jgi:uncharacterized membrane protein YagU involved in acid resistance